MENYLTAELYPLSTPFAQVWPREAMEVVRDTLQHRYADSDAQRRATSIGAKGDDLFYIVLNLPMPKGDRLWLATYLMQKAAERMWAEDGWLDTTLGLTLLNDCIDVRQGVSKGGKSKVVKEYRHLQYRAAARKRLDLNGKWVLDAMRDRPCPRPEDEMPKSAPASVVMVRFMKALLDAFEEFCDGQAAQLRCEFTTEEKRSLLPDEAWAAILNDKLDRWVDRTDELVRRGRALDWTSADDAPWRYMPGKNAFTQGDEYPGWCAYWEDELRSETKLDPERLARITTVPFLLTNMAAPIGEDGRVPLFDSREEMSALLARYWMDADQWRRDGRGSTTLMPVNPVPFLDELHQGDQPYRAEAPMRLGAWMMRMPGKPGTDEEGNAIPGAEEKLRSLRDAGCDLETLGNDWDSHSKLPYDLMAQRGRDVIAAGLDIGLQEVCTIATSSGEAALYRMEDHRGRLDEYLDRLTTDIIDWLRTQGATLLVIGYNGERTMRDRFQDLASRGVVARYKADFPFQRFIPLLARKAKGSGITAIITAEPWTSTISLKEPIGGDALKFYANFMKRETEDARSVIKYDGMKVLIKFESGIIRPKDDVAAMFEKCVEEKLGGEMSDAVSRGKVPEAQVLADIIRLRNRVVGYQEWHGMRINRDWYVNADGTILQSDVNGALNILRLGARFTIGDLAEDTLLRGDGLKDIIITGDPGEWVANHTRTVLPQEDVPPQEEYEDMQMPSILEDLATGLGTLMDVLAQDDEDGSTNPSGMGESHHAG